MNHWTKHLFINGEPFKNRGLHRWHPKRSSYKTFLVPILARRNRTSPFAKKKRGGRIPQEFMGFSHLFFFFFGQQVGVIMKDCSKNEKDWCWFKDFWETNPKLWFPMLSLKGWLRGWTSILMRPTLRVLQSGSREAVTGSSQEVPNMGRGPP